MKIVDIYIYIYTNLFTSHIHISIHYMYIWWMSLDVPISLSSIVPSTAKSRPSPRLRRQQRAQPQWLDFCSSHSEAPGTCWPWPWSETCSETWPPRCWPWAWWIPFPHIQQPPRNPGFRGGFTHIWDHIWVFKYLEYSGDHPRKQPVRLLLRICIAFRLPEGKKSGDVLSRGFEPLRKRDVDHSSQKNTVQRHHLSMKRQQNRPSCPMR